MYCKKILALGGAFVLAGAATASTAAAAGTTVTVRVEGKSKTLLPAKSVTAHGGVVRMDGHTCPGTSGAGALNAATHGAWSGKFFTGLGIEVLKILGETDSYTSTKSYWELFVNNVASQQGMCGITLHRGEQILFAAVPATGTEYPLEVIAPSHVSKGHAFTVTVKAWGAHGKAKPLAGAKVGGATTNRHGTATLTLTHTGKTTLTATSKGFIRAEAQLRVS
jgi:hypothetical protein